MLNRRDLLTVVPLTAFAMNGEILARAQDQARQPGSPSGLSPESVIASPPVIQHRTSTGFTVCFKVSGLATGWVEWGTAENELNHRAMACHHGLKMASDLALSIRVESGPSLSNTPIFYRVAAQRLTIQGRELIRGEPQFGSSRQLRPWLSDSQKVRIAVVNDTHENVETISRLAKRIEEWDPDLLIWNGDTTNDFHPERDVAGILLKPGQIDATERGGWASTRPLVFVPGNHDVRGVLASQVQTCLPGWPSGTNQGGANTPYCSLIRMGPLAFVTLDTGEDKPDAHPLFRGTAAYEPYREQQAAWLADAIQRPEFVSAPFRLAFCHIPLRGLPGHPDGTTLDGYAYFSGFGSRLWMSKLVEGRIQAIISGHMHQHRIDPSTEQLPPQIVLGGPKPDTATLTRIAGDASKLSIILENLDGKELRHLNLEPLK